MQAGCRALSPRSTPAPRRARRHHAASTGSAARHRPPAARCPHHGLGRSHPSSSRAAAEPPPSRRSAAPTAAAAAAATGAGTITGTRFAPPRPIPARLANLNPGGHPIARPLLVLPRPRHHLPNGCLFLHTAHGGGASSPDTYGPACERGRGHARLSACPRGSSRMNGVADQ